MQGLAIGATRPKTAVGAEMTAQQNLLQPAAPLPQNGAHGAAAGLPQHATLKGRRLLSALGRVIGAPVVVVFPVDESSISIYPPDHLWHSLSA